MATPSKTYDEICRDDTEQKRAAGIVCTPEKCCCGWKAKGERDGSGGEYSTPWPVNALCYDQGYDEGMADAAHESY